MEQRAETDTLVTLPVVLVVATGKREGGREGRREGKREGREGGWEGWREGRREGWREGLCVDKWDMGSYSTCKCRSERSSLDDSPLQGRIQTLVLWKTQIVSIAENWEVEIMCACMYQRYR